MYVVKKKSFSYPNSNLRKAFTRMWNTVLPNTCFCLTLFYCNFEDQLSPIFNRLFIWCIYWDTPSEVFDKFLLPKVHCLYTVLLTLVNAARGGQRSNWDERNFLYRKPSPWNTSKYAKREAGSLVIGRECLYPLYMSLLSRNLYFKYQVLWETVDFSLTGFSWLRLVLWDDPAVKAASRRNSLWVLPSQWVQTWVKIGGWASPRRWVLGSGAGWVLNAPLGWWLTYSYLKTIN